MEQFAEKTNFESFALKAFHVMPALILQKPGSKCKNKELNEHVLRRLELWECGELRTLYHEGKAIQQKLEKKEITQKRKEQVFFQNYCCWETIKVPSNGYKTQKTVQIR